MRTVLESLLDKLTCLEKYEDYVEKLNLEAVKSQNSTNVVSGPQCLAGGRCPAEVRCDICGRAVTCSGDGRRRLPSRDTFTKCMVLARIRSYSKCRCGTHVSVRDSEMSFMCNGLLWRAAGNCNGGAMY